MVSKRPSPLPPCSAVLAALRHECGWSGQELATVAELSRDTISRYENGTVAFDREQLVKLARHLGVSRDRALARVEVAERLATATVKPANPLEPDEEVQADLTAQAVSLLLGFEPLVYRGLRKEWAEKRIVADRRRAVALIEALEGLPPAERRARIEGDGAYRSWALPIELCERSIRSVGASIAEAGEWTALARLAAEVAEVPESWRPRLRACTLFFRANVDRVGNDLAQAERNFQRGWEAWKASDASDFPLGEWRFLDLEASLRSDQRRWDEALSLLQRAIETASRESRARLQVQLGRFLNDMGETSAALDALRPVQAEIEASPDIRVRLALASQLTVSLLELGRAAEAATFADEALRLAEVGGWPLDRLRCEWAVGRVAGAKGQKGLARLTLKQVREQFAARNLGLDAALVGLDEALLLLGEGALDEVQDLSRELLPILRSGQLGPDALVTLRVFCLAARRQEATTDLARATVRSLQNGRSRFHADFLSTG